MSTWDWTGVQGALWARQDSNGFDGSSGDGANQSFAADGSETSQSALINELRFQAARSVRMSTVILAAFNVLAALATALGILWDAYATKKRCDPSYKIRTSGLSFIAPTETFTLIMAIGIVIQGSVFAGVQSTGLDSMMILGCTIPSQIMLPTIFIVPYIQFIFGLENTVRALKRQPFPSRSKWTVPVCCAILGISILATVLVAQFISPPNFCFASLFWFVQWWKEGILAVLILIAATLLICTAIIFWRLSTSLDVNITERIAASRMVYYLAIAVVFVTLQIPFFYSLVVMDLRTAGSGPLNLSMIAAVVANLSGLANGGLHLLLRANCLAAIGPQDKSDKERTRLKADTRRDASDNDTFSLRSAGYPPATDSRLNANKTLTFSSQYRREEEENVESPLGTPTYERPNPLRLQSAPSTTRSLRPPEPVHQPSRMETLKAQLRKSSFSLLPRDNGSKSFGLLPATTYTPTDEKNGSEQEPDLQSLMPVPLFLHDAERHGRNSSVSSHATVQIGMRFSNVHDASRLQSRYLEKVQNLDYPKEKDRGLALGPSCLATDQVATLEDEDGLAATKSDSSTLLSRSLMKSLPEPPRATLRASEFLQGPCTLTSAVYDPTSPSKKVVTSPQGLGSDTVPKRPSGSYSLDDRLKCPKSNCRCDALHKGEWI